VQLNEQQEVRLAKVRALREAGTEPYPQRADRTHTAAAASEAFTVAEPTLADGRLLEQVVVTGRVFNCIFGRMCL
jgi:lysyl-tRNA synthetase class II